MPVGAALLHGAVARPPHVDWHATPPQAARLLHCDAEAVRAMPGVVAVVVRASFVGVVATSPQAAGQGVDRLHLRWSAPPAPRPAAGTPAATVVLAEHGDVDRPGALTVAASYRWPLTPADSGSTWAIARLDENGLTVWAPIASAAGLRADLAALLELHVDQVRVACVEGDAACPEARHAAADAALLAQAVGHAVRVTLTPAQVRVGDGYLFSSHVSADLGADQGLAAYTMVTGATPPSAPPLALVLADIRSPVCQIAAPSCCAVPPYTYPALRISAVQAAGAAPGRARVCA
jgi:nicotinate dehydrogenase subunit B